MATKKEQVTATLDQARCKSDTAALPDAARRYSKYKGDPSGEVLRQIALAEVDLNEALKSVGRADPAGAFDDTFTINIDDDKIVSSFSVSHTLPVVGTNPAHCKLFDNVRKALRSANDANGAGPEEHYQLAVLLARTHFHGNDFDAAARVLSPLTPTPHSTISPAYGVCIYYMHVAMYGIILEHSGQHSAALDLYLEAASYANGHPHAPEHNETTMWLEEIMYRLPFIAQYVRQLQFVEQYHSSDDANEDANDDDVLSMTDLFSDEEYTNAVYSAFRQYADLSCNWPRRSFRLERRGHNLRVFIKYLSGLQHAGLALPGREVSFASLSNNGFIPKTFRDEMIDLHLRCEEHLSSCKVGQFPHSNRVNDLILELVDQTLLDWQLFGASQRESDVRRLIDILYRATRLTFHSPRILRHLAHALMAVGEYYEAELVIRSYTELAKKQLELLEKERTARASAITMDDNGSSSKEENADELPNITVSASTEPVDIKRDLEPVVLIIETLIIAARLDLQHLNKSQQCVDHAEFALELCNKYSQSEMLDAASIREGLTVTPALHSLALQFVAAGCGAIAMNTSNPDTRKLNQARSLGLFEQAAELNPGNAELHYQHALQLAEGRDTIQAIAAIKKAIGIDKSHLPSFNLLALLLTSQQDLQSALRTCEIGLRESAWHSVDLSLQSQISADAAIGGSIASRRQSVVNHNTATSANIAVAGSSGSSDDGVGAGGKRSISSRRSTISHYPAETPEGGSVEEGEEYLELKITQARILELIHGPEIALKLHSPIFALFARIYPSITLSSAAAAAAAAVSAPSTGTAANAAQQSMQRRQTPSKGSILGGIARRHDSASSTGTLLRRKSMGDADQYAQLGIQSQSQQQQQQQQQHQHQQQNGSRSASAQVVGDVKNGSTPSFAEAHANYPPDSPANNAAATDGVLAASAAISSPPSGNLRLSKSRKSLLVSSKRSGNDASSTDSVNGTRALTNVNSHRHASGNGPMMHSGFAESTLMVGFPSSQQQQQQQQQQQPPSSPHGSGSVTPSAAAVINGTYAGRPVATKSRHHIERGSTVLAGLWLTSADAFRRLGKHNDARDAIAEAQRFSPESVEAWHQRGLLALAAATPDSHSESIRHFESALALDSQYVTSQVQLAQIYFEQKRTAMADGLLQAVVKSRGWDLAEAWYLIGRIAVEAGEADKAKDALMYALQLEGTRPVRPYHILSR
ncbi:hypothetical protein GQ42DRAFT_24134 [Ramicandelaber brevisporus]|nr:hypothetical protein GQ42DRAFT_24134 [Ramicandelaber brevisporus]